MKYHRIDPESAKIKGPHGVIQGYNGIAVADSKHQVIVAAEAFGSGAEVGLFEQMLTQVEENMGELTGKEKPLEKALVLGDTGYFSEENLKVAEEHEVAVLIPDQQFHTWDERFESRTDQHKGRYPLDQFTFNEETNSYSCPAGKELSYKGEVKLNRNRGKKYQAKRSDCKECPCREKCIASRGSTKAPKRTLFVSDKAGSDNRCERMREKIDEVENRIKYGQRMHIREPVFVNIRYCKEMNRFTMRGKVPVNRQWLLYCTVHNIEKCVEAYGPRGHGGVK